MLGLINAIVSSAGAIAGYVKDGLVMANRFLTPPKITHPAQGSAEFNGSSDYIDLGTDLDESLNGDFTISAWVNSDVTTTGFIVHSTTSADTKIIAGIRFNDLGFWLGVDNGTAYWKQTGSALNTGQWYYCTATFTASTNTIKIFVDGSDRTTAASGIAGFGSGEGYVVIGKRFGINDLYFDGNLANVAIWNRALSSDEINAVMWKGYQSLTDNEKSGLKAWYSLDDITSPAASLANMEQLATDKDATIENKAAITAAVNALS